MQEAGESFLEGQLDLLLHVLEPAVDHRGRDADEGKHAQRAPELVKLLRHLRFVCVCVGGGTRIKFTQ